MSEAGARVKATVVGAGFTGLVTAYFLEKKGYAVDVFERAEREGGLISTTPTVSGPSESAANAFLNSVRVEALFQDIGVRLVPAGKASRARFIFRGGRPRRWPIGVGASFRIFGFLIRYFFRRGTVAPRTGETLAEWGRRVFGAEATEFLLLPAFQGIYAGEGSRLSASLLLSGIFGPRTGARPRIRGSVSAAGGMGEVVGRLRAHLESRGVRFHFRTDGSAIDPTVLTYFCGSAADASAALAEIDPETSRILGRIELLPLITVTAFFPTDRRIRPGFGVLFPPSESFRSLGVLYNHVIFPHRVTRDEVISETWILGGARRPDVVRADVDTLLAEFLADRKRLLGFDAAGEPPIHYVLHRWPKAIPYYSVELEGILAELSRRAGGSGKLRLMGNYLGGIGLSKILDRVALEIEKNA